ncbi:circularly permuted type 2 ATP-grasp protein [Variovorax arabinosiphilus]|uniref:circularly permuted type 2 ATP-grasp protein n=1 Tax=Variovorax arabinosiphilus TaxID=3053498 RepID=UPI0025751DF4|nr:MULTISPECIES: circularly permuted type 2 ATP-grasp protein [unclassified Variovorax]MDM0119710.1 circularly permuted type 2 ATP-grasp protein [Variovorax sp. J2L1-78]MDM0128378.1 circularly permuted type 2 ATP-grasp protein [Variovorax sp. J2L1-63]MDM0232078.1 circularly permuted type 2 ATP-grasp protein [Variovorax sp. J2R1-6]
MEPLNDSLFGAQSLESPAALASALAPPAAPGHFDELRGAATPAAAPRQQPAPAGTPLHDAALPPPAAPESPGPATATPELTPPWARFFEHLGSGGFTDLPRRAINLERQIRDNGVTYNVYADADGPQRPWSLDLFPLIVSPESWTQIEAGVLQRVRVLDRVMADVYGPQQLLAEGLLPDALVRGHPGYLRPMHGVKPPGDTWLHIAAFDLARGPDGNWWVVSQRTQAPSGLGYLLENRLAVSRQFPQAFEELQVQRLAATYSAMMEGLQRMCPAGSPPHIALLTPGPYNETYFEHAYLARYLGITLVEGNDLTVRDQRVYLKTLQGLRPVHGLIKRLDDQFLDPLELRPDSTLGVPGLLQAIRAGNLLVANMPGSAFLESPALLGFLPALARRLIGEKLQLPALPTWWCGERAALESALPQLGDCAIKATYPGYDSHTSFEAVLGSRMSRRELDEWAGRIVRQGDEHTVQSYLPLSQMPTWAPNFGRGHIAPRAVMLRVFAVSDGPQSWRVLPGGLARLAGADAQIASMQRGGSSADVWVQTHGEVDRTTLLQPHATPASLARHRAPVTSRAAENMFWLGRYTERAENAVRLARLVLDRLGGEEPSSRPLLEWLHGLSTRNTLIAPEVPIGTKARRVFERALIADLGNVETGGSVGYNLRCVRQAAAAVRERLSQDHWNQIVRAEEEFLRRTAEQEGEERDGSFAAGAALHSLEAASAALSAMTGAQTDRMTRDDAWRLLSIGRHIERLAFLSSALAAGFKGGAVHEVNGFEAMVALFDSTITFHARYQQRRDVATLVDLLVLDGDNPRSLAWVTQTLRGRIARLAGSAPGKLTALSYELPDPAMWTLENLCEVDADGQYPALVQLFEFCETAAYHVSDAIGIRYFTLTSESLRSVGV